MNIITQMPDNLEFSPVDSSRIPTENQQRGRPRIHADPKAAKRERDKAYRERKKAQAATPEPAPTTTLSDDVESLTKEYQEAGPSATPPVSGAPIAPPFAGGTAAPVGPPMVTGFILLAFMDAIMPSLVNMLMRRFRKCEVRNPDKLQFTDGEREALMPLADQAAGYILSKVHPVALFMGASFFLTYGKAQALAVPIAKE